MDNDFEDEGDIWGGLSNDDLLAIDLSENEICMEQNKVDDEKGSRTLFLKNFSYDVNPEEIRQIFNDSGEIESLEFVKDFKGRNKGRAYLIFKNINSAQKALTKNRHPIQGRPLYIKSKIREIEKDKLFIKGLPYSMTEEDVKNLFLQHGPIKDIRLLVYRNGNSKGKCYIDYLDEETASKVQSAMDGIHLENMIISVKFNNPPLKRPWKSNLTPLGTADGTWQTRPPLAVGDQKDEALNENEDIKRKLNDAAEEGEPSTKSLKRTKVPTKPLEYLRKGYLWVTDFSNQLWCEKQMEYTKLLPKRVVKALETDESKKGTRIHLARELEVQKYVNIKVKSKEDRFAVKILNLLITLKKLQRQTDNVHREIPIFGLVRGIFVMGKIDELRMNNVDFTIDIVDLKTRRFKTIPKKSQKASHSLQLMIYKHLFDDLVRGLLPQHSIATILRLKLAKELGAKIVNHITKDMGHLDFSTPPDGKWNITALLNEIRATAEGLPFISRLFNEYVWQENGESFAMDEVKYDDQWFDGQASHCVSYWTGQREACGVDVEDAWKCHSCDFQDDCTWIRRKMQERNEELKRRKEAKIVDNRTRVTITKYNRLEDIYFQEPPG